LFQICWSAGWFGRGGVLRRCGAPGALGFFAALWRGFRLDGHHPPLRGPSILISGCVDDLEDHPEAGKEAAPPPRTGEARVLLGVVARGTGRFASPFGEVSRRVMAPLTSLYPGSWTRSPTWT